MQIVDEADETETIVARPSFFDALQTKIKTTPPKPPALIKNAQSPTSQANLKFIPEASPKNKASSQMPALNLSLRLLNEQMRREMQPVAKKPAVPSFSLPPRSKIVTSEGMMTGFKSTRGFN